LVERPLNREIASAVIGREETATMSSRDVSRRGDRRLRAQRGLRFVVSNVQGADFSTPSRPCRDVGTLAAGRERVTMSRTNATLLTLAGVLIVTVVHAQGLQLAITDEQLYQAARDAASPPAVWVFGDVMTRRRIRGDYRTAGGGYVSDLKTFTRMQQSVPRPFRIHVATPYMRAVATFVDAKRRFAPMPQLNSESLNAEGVVVSVLPGVFADADAIEDVVVRPPGAAEDVAIHPMRRIVEPQTITNRAGATRELSSGVFYFALNAFADLPVDVICVGRNGNESFRIDVADLEALTFQR
jgi:hypothetical protein